MKEGDLKLQLPLDELRRDGERWSYVVTYMGVEYPLRLFPSQRKMPKPAVVDCVLKKSSDGSTRMQQDYAPLIAQLYKVGQEYDFKLKRSTKRFDEWAVESIPDGLEFVLEGNPKSGVRVERSLIRCRVKEVRGVLVRVEEVRGKSQTVELDKHISPKTLGKVVGSCEFPASAVRLFVKIFDHDPALNTARELLRQQRPEWFSEVLRIARRDLASWLGKTLKPQHQMELLEHVRRVGVEVIERSGLTGGEDELTSKLRGDIERTLHLIESYTLALNKIGHEEMGRYGSEIVTSLSKTGYIYQPEERLEVLRSAMVLDAGLEASIMPDLLDMMLQRPLPEWQKEPLRRALLLTLESHVRSLQGRADRLLQGTQGEGRELAKRLVKVLSMLLLLTEGAEAVVNRHLIMCRLCRYASLLNPRFADALTRRAYAFLLAAVPTTLPFRWTDVAQGSTDIISYKLSALPMPVTLEVFSHEGAKGRVVCRSQGLELHQRGYVGKEHNALPDKLLPWPMFQVRLGGKKGDKEVDATSKDFMQLRRSWRDVEERLFGAPAAEEKSESQRQVRAPEVGDQVFVKVLRSEGDYDEKGNPLFRAVIDDPEMGVEGEGVLSPLGLVHYYVKGATLDCFRNEEGKPYSILVEVESVDKDGICRFNGQKLAGDFLYENVRVGQVLRCRVSRDQLPDKYLLVSSDYGFSLQVRKDGRAPELRTGEPCEVTVEQVYENGDIDARFERRLLPDPKVSDVSDFGNFVRFYTEESLGEDVDNEEDAGPGQSEQSQQPITREEVLELVSLLDRRGTMQSDADRAMAFNYLCAAKILAECVSDDQRVTEYRERMTLIDLTEQFATNQRLDADEYAEHYHRSISTLGAFPELHSQALALYCVSRMGRGGNEAELMEIAQQNSGRKTGDLANLVMAYNVLLPYGLEEANGQIRSAINQRLGTETEGEKKEHLGEEGPGQEFKSSMIYPADNGMRPDPNAQMLKLMQVLCGMMNTQGGRLLVGVNDMGYARGLDEDYKYLCKSPLYDRQKAQDVMDNQFLQTLRKHMPKEAADYLSSHFEQHDGQDVYVVECTPSKGLMTVDSRWFRRFGRSTNEMDRKEAKSLEQMKRARG